MSGQRQESRVKESCHWEGGVVEKNDLVSLASSLNEICLLDLMLLF